MDMPVLLSSIVMGVIEGVTEFLPISSTGHLIIAGELLHFLDKEKRDIYEIFIQLGAMMAVIWEYRFRLGHAVVGSMRSQQQRRFLVGLAIAFMPAAILGLLFGKSIKQHLFSPVPVAIAFILGGLIILYVEGVKHPTKVNTVEDMSFVDAFKVGLLQCLALIPGTSRSGATIIGGLFVGLSRKAATEFSFFLGIPTLGAASLYSLYKVRNDLSLDDAGIFAVGFLAAFISAFFVIRAMIKFVADNTFVVFAWYRMAFGLIVLLNYWVGAIGWSV